MGAHASLGLTTRSTVFLVLASPYTTFGRSSLFLFDNSMFISLVSPYCHPILDIHVLLGLKHQLNHVAQRGFGKRE